MLLITNSVTEPLLEPVAGHITVVVIKRLGHCVMLNPAMCSMFFIIFLFFNNCFTLRPHRGRFYRNILLSFPKPQMSQRYFTMWGKHPDLVSLSCPLIQSPLCHAVLCQVLLVNEFLQLSRGFKLPIMR